MYYSQETIEQVIAANDIVDVVGSYVQLKRAGSGYKGLCPFHSEKTPSFSVSPTRQTYHCFGCGEGGNVVSFIMKYENDTFPEALKVLADRAGIRLPEADFTAQERARSAQRARLLAINKEAASYYYRLLRSPKGRTGWSYLSGRGLSNEVMRNFGLGYADGTSSDLIAHLREKGFADEDILAAGVAVFDEKKGLRDKFWNRVMFPIMDAASRVIGFGGRVMGEGKPKYLNSPETPVFDKSRNLYGLNIAKRSRTGSFILCEGYMDVIAMHQAGFSQAVASLGTSFTEGQALVLRRYVKEVMLAYDSDGAGVRAAIRNIEVLNRAGLTGRVVNLEPYKDPDELIRGLGAEEFQKRLDRAENSFYYRIRQLSKDYSMSDPAQRTVFYQEIAKRLCTFEDEIERDSYIRGMASEYFIDEGMLRREVAKYAGAIGTGLQAGGEATGYGSKRAGTMSQGHVSTGAEPSAFAGNTQDAGIRRRKDAPKMTDTGLQGTAAAGNPGSTGDRASERSVLRDERLLLTFIAEDPNLYPQIRDYISADDFTPGIPRRTAETYFAILEREIGDSLAVASGSFGKVFSTPARVIASFEEEEEQSAAAAMFETRIPDLPPEGREKAFRDVLGSVKRAALQRLSADLNDPDALSKLVRLKKDLQIIQKIPLHMEDESEDM